MEQTEGDQVIDDREEESKEKRVSALRCKSVKGAEVFEKISQRNEVCDEAKWLRKDINGIVDPA